MTFTPVCSKTPTFDSVVVKTTLGGTTYTFNNFTVLHSEKVTTDQFNVSDIIDTKNGKAYKFTGKFIETTERVETEVTRVFIPQFEEISLYSYRVFEDADGKVFYMDKKQGGSEGVFTGLPTTTPVKADSNGKKYTFAYWMYKDTSMMYTGEEISKANNSNGNDDWTLGNYTFVPVFFESTVTSYTVTIKDESGHIFYKGKAASNSLVSYKDSESNDVKYSYMTSDGYKVSFTGWKNNKDPKTTKITADTEFIVLNSKATEKTKVTLKIHAMDDSYVYKAEYNYGEKADISSKYLTGAPKAPEGYMYSGVLGYHYKDSEKIISKYQEILMTEDTDVYLVLNLVGIVYEEITFGYQYNDIIEGNNAYKDIRYGATISVDPEIIARVPKTRTEEAYDMYGRYYKVSTYNGMWEDEDGHKYPADRIVVTTSNGFSPCYDVSRQEILHTVTFKDENGTVLATHKVPDVFWYSQSSAYEVPTVSKKDTTSTHYEFMGWFSESGVELYGHPITADTVFTAKFDEQVKKYNFTVIAKIKDGDNISTEYLYNEAVGYNQFVNKNGTAWQDYQKALKNNYKDNDTYTYTVAWKDGREPDITKAVVGNVSYELQVTKQIRKYEVKYYIKANNGYDKKVLYKTVTYDAGSKFESISEMTVYYFDPELYPGESNNQITIGANNFYTTTAPYILTNPQNRYEQNEWQGVYIYGNLEFTVEGVYETTKYEITLYTNPESVLIYGAYSSYVENGVTKYYKIPATLKVRKGMTIAQSLELFPEDNGGLVYRADMFKNVCISPEWEHYEKNYRYDFVKWVVTKNGEDTETTTIDMNQKLTSNMKMNVYFKKVLNVA